MTKKQKRVLIRIIISAVLLGVLMIIKIDNPYIKFAAFMAPYLIIGYDILKKAVKGIFNRQVFDENFLMAIATVGAIILAVKQNSDYAEAIAVMLFYQIGELFQSYAVGKSRRNIASLMDIRPDIAKVEIDGEIKELDPEEVEAGSIIVISPGEKIPIDAVIIEGNATLNTSALTGESVPREVGAGDEIISGCINENGVIRAKTTKPFGESTVAKILDLVENSSMKKAKSEQFITKFARYYTPAVVFSALALGIVPCVINLILGNSPEWGKWIYRALTFLIISCPCALVISIPLTFFAGIGGASHTSDYEAEIRALARNDERIVFTGFIQGEELVELYSNAYIYVLPSDLEGMPISLLEAMSYGNCCLTSDIEECTEVCEDKAEYFEKGNESELKAALEFLLNNPDKVSEYKNNAAGFILNKYDWDNVVNKTLELYKNNG